MMRLSVEANRREEAAATGSPGLDSCRWLKPVRPGDTLTGRTEVLETWPSEAKPIGFVRRRVEMMNQQGEAVVAIVGITMYRRRPAGGDGMKYFEDVAVGDIMRFGRYEVTKEEIVEYARQFDPQPFHLDEDAARARACSAASSRAAGTPGPCSSGWWSST